MKTAVIVEGCSDKKFMDEYLKKHFDTSLRFKTVMSKANCHKGCEILKYDSMSKKIETLIEDDGREKVFVLIDYKTECKGKKVPDCITELKAMYYAGLRKHLKAEYFSKVEVVVVERELESWMVSKWESSNNRRVDYSVKLKNYVGDKVKEEAVSAFIIKALKEKVHINPTNNTSLDRFLTKMRACR